MDEVEEIKHKLDIVDYISHYVTLKKAGSNYKAPCPFHDERTPSFMVSPEKQIFKCFGCGKGGDIFAFVMEQDSVDFKEALELLAEKTGTQLRKDKTRNSQLANPQTGKSTLYQINMSAAQLWHKILVDHPAGKQALQYLRGRKITDETIKHFLIGYAASQDTTYAFLTKRGFNAEQIKTAGSPNRFFNRIMFPFFDVLGNIVAFTGRATQAGQEPKYLNTPETSLYHKSRYIYGLHTAKPAIKKLDQVIIVEGQMDVVASYQAGVTNVVATSGTAITRDHLMILARYSPNVVFAFDADEAGQKAAKNAINLALDLELTIRLVKIPDGLKDVGEIVEKDPALWAKTAKDALPWMEWLLASSQFPILSSQLRSVEQKKKIAKEVLPYLARVKDPIEQAHWLKKLASLLNIKEEAVGQALAKFLIPNSKFLKDKPVITRQPLSLKEELLGLLLCYPQFQKLNTELFENLKKWYNKPVKELELVVQTQFKDLPAKDVEKAIGQLIARIADEKTHDVKDEFAQKIAQADQDGDTEKIKQLFKELQESLKKNS